MKQLQNEKGKFNTFILRGIFIAIITYLISQTTFSIFLTELFNSTNSKNTFNYNIFISHIRESMVERFINND